MGIYGFMGIYGLMMTELVWTDEKMLEIDSGMVASHSYHRTVHLTTVKMAHFVMCIFYHN